MHNHDKRDEPATSDLPERADVAFGLRSYVLLKQEIGDVAREALSQVEHVEQREQTERAQAQEASVSGELREMERALRDLLVKLAEDRFNLVVVGQFKRGKSSLMNALIGRNLLPTGLLPLTSAITTLRYGSRVRVTLQREGWSVEQEIPLRELADYVTEEGNPGNQKGLIEARVELPARFLRRGLFFIDTPGAGSVSEQATAATLAFLPQADAIIFVTSVEAPMSDIEIAFLETIREYAQAVFVVVNKMDQLQPLDQVDVIHNHAGDTAQVLSFIRQHASAALGRTDIALFPVSARQGLLAQRRRDDQALAASGIPALERALTDYLARQQGRVFLLRALDQLAHVLDLPDMAALGDSARLRARVDELRPQIARIENPEYLTNLENLEERGPTPERVAIAVAPAAPSPTAVVAALSQHSPSLHTLPHPALAPDAGRCPICAALSSALFTSLSQWQYALGTSEEARRAFAAVGGFCVAHTWQFERIASPQTISEAYVPLVARLDTELRAALNSVSQPASPPETRVRSFQEIASRVERLTSRPGACPACQALAAERARQVAEFVERLSAPDDAQWSDSQLCLPHLADALAVASAHAHTAESARVVAALLRTRIQGMEDLADDLRSYLLKRAALRKGLLTAEEDSAWRRALTTLVSERDANLPSR